MTHLGNDVFQVHLSISGLYQQNFDLITEMYGIYYKSALFILYVKI